MITILIKSGFQWFDKISFLSLVKINHLSLYNFISQIKKSSKSKIFYLFPDRMGIVQKSNAIVASSVNCAPELQTIPLDHGEPKDRMVLYYPSCVRIQRCGGCCNHQSLSCEPTSKEIKNYRIMVISLNPSLMAKFQEYKIVPVEEHKSCTCECKKKPKVIQSNSIFNTAKSMKI